MAWILFAAAGIAFWGGGWAIHEFAKIERVLAEAEGIGLTVLFGVLGAVAKIGADRLEGGQNEPLISEGKFLRK